MWIKQCETTEFIKINSITIISVLNSTLVSNLTMVSVQDWGAGLSDRSVIRVWDILVDWFWKLFFCISLIWGADQIRQSNLQLFPL